MKKMTVGQRIVAGFALVLLLSFGVGAIGLLTMRGVRQQAERMQQEFVPEADLGAELARHVASTQISTRSYGLTAETKYLSEIKTGMGEIDQRLTGLERLAKDHPSLQKLHELLPQLQAARKGFADAVARTEATNVDLTASRERMNAAAATFTGSMDDLLRVQHERLSREVRDFTAAEQILERQQKIRLVTEIRDEAAGVRIAAFKGQALRQTGLIEDGLKHFTGMDARFQELRGLLKVAADLEELDKARASAGEYRKNLEEVVRDMRTLDEISAQRAKAGAEFMALAAETAEMGMKRTVSAAEEAAVSTARSSFLTTVLLTAAAGLGIGVAFVIIRSITKPLLRMAGLLGSGSQEIASAASQVSSSSQQLAAGASQQAASVEETSASIEEMTSMTKRNAASAQDARAAAQQARQAVDESARSVEHLDSAMSALQTSSGEVAKIVKTIDEIAFQTNILALNAAVEAARAGEAGAGFAVVADEVRSLAQRAAGAAKETAVKIEHAVAKSAEGAVISQEVGAKLRAIVEHVRKVDSLVAEIAQASAEQASGIGQLNQAVSQVDQVTQGNAAAAEECAAAAEELNAQAAELRSAVGELLTMVGAESQEDDSPVQTPKLPPAGEATSGKTPRLEIARAA
jgi:methyl-accepting chemotaxis protein